MKLIGLTNLDPCLTAKACASYFVTILFFSSRSDLHPTTNDGIGFALCFFGLPFIKKHFRSNRKNSATSNKNIIFNILLVISCYPFYLQICSSNVEDFGMTFDPKYHNKIRLPLLHSKTSLQEIQIYFFLLYP